MLQVHLIFTNIFIAPVLESALSKELHAFYGKQHLETKIRAFSVLIVKSYLLDPLSKYN